MNKLLRLGRTILNVIATIGIAIYCVVMLHLIVGFFWTHPWYWIAGFIGSVLWFIVRKDLQPTR